MPYTSIPFTLSIASSEDQFTQYVQVVQHLTVAEKGCAALFCMAPHSQAVQHLGKALLAVIHWALQQAHWALQQAD